MSGISGVIRPLVMLLGSPRSGTTWLAKIIDSHPSVLYRHEPDSINVRPDIPFVPQPDDLDRYLPICRDYLGVILAERSSKSAGSLPVFPKEYRGPVDNYLHKAAVYGVKVGERLGGSSSFFSRVQIPDMIKADNMDAVLPFIKSVSSLCRAYMFSLCDPSMQFIHIIRHPCAYVASTMRGKKLGLLSDDAYIETLASMPQSREHGVTLDSLRSMSREEQLAVRWMLQNEKVMREMDGNPGYKTVVYEELCNNPRQVTAEIFSFLGLPFSEQTKEFLVKSSEGKGEAARYFDVKRDSAAAATRWKNELSPTKIDAIRRVVSNSEVGRLYFQH